MARDAAETRNKKVGFITSYMKDSPKDKFKYLDNTVALVHGGNLEKPS